MLGKVFHFSKDFTKHFAQETCHYLGYNNALSTISEFSFAVYYLKIESEIYKGNSEKYKGKIELEQLWHYGCQKNRYDLWNAAIEHKLTRNSFLGRKNRKLL